MAKKTDESKSEDLEPTTPRVDPYEVMNRLAAALEGAKQQAPSSDMEKMMGLLTEAMNRIAESQTQGAQLMAAETRRAHRPSNEVTHGISVFNQRGQLLDDYKKPRLKCLMLLPWLAEWESLTCEEVELLNLLEAGSYSLIRIDRTKVKVSVVIDYGVDEVTPSRLVMNHDTAFNNDNFRLMPPLSDMLRQILKQHSAEIAQQAAVVLTEEEVAAMIACGDLSVSV